MGMMLRRYHEEAVEAASSEVPVDDLDSRTVNDLREYAMEHGIDLGDAKKKAEIIVAIRAHQDATPDSSSQDGEGTQGQDPAEA